MTLIGAEKPRLTDSTGRAGTSANVEALRRLRQR